MFPPREETRCQTVTGDMPVRRIPAPVVIGNPAAFRARSLGANCGPLGHFPESRQDRRQQSWETLAMRGLWVVLFAVTHIAGFSGAAAAQTREQHRQWCVQETDRDLQIGGCTAVIQSGQETQNNLAIALSNRGLAYADKGQHDRAIQDYDQAIRLNPNHAGAFNGRCFSRAILGQLQLALKDCDASLRLRPNDAATFDSRGFTYLKLGRLAEAIADYDAALRLNPKSAASLHGHGLAHIARNDQAQGKRDIAVARQIDPDIAAKFLRWGVREP